MTATQLDELRVAFKHTVNDFCEGLLSDFPDCAKLQSAWDKWDCTINQCSSESIRVPLLDKAMRSFDQNLREFYVRIHQKDPSVMDEITHPLFTSLDLRGKYDKYATDERDLVFAHIDSMCAIVANYVMYLARRDGNGATTENM